MITPEDGEDFPMYLLDTMEVLERNGRVPREPWVEQIRALLESAVIDGLDWRRLYEAATEANAEFGPFPSPEEVAP